MGLEYRVVSLKTLALPSILQADDEEAMNRNGVYCYVYSPKCLEGRFSEVRLDGLLRWSPYSPRENLPHMDVRERYAIWGMPVGADAC
jgi:hypothetical protein